MMLKYLKDKIVDIKQIYRSRLGAFNFKIPGKFQITLGDAQNAAANYNGRCLSKEVLSASSTLTWKCQKGHTWTNSFSKIKQGDWCQMCAKDEERKRNFMNTLKYVVEKKGGKCISGNYENIYTKFLFECENKHVWHSNYLSVVSQNNWCSVCREENRSSRYLKKLQIIASVHKGKCLSENYKNSFSKLKWQCKNGHIFSMSPQIVKQNQWCLKCDQQAIKEKELYKLNLIASEKDGRCLSTDYKMEKSKLTWECNNGHNWEMSALDAKNGKWCSKCNRDIACKKELERLKLFAGKKGGHCLSEIYENNYSNMEWKCDKGHTWLATSMSIKKTNGSWCPVCAFNRMKGKGTIKKPNIVIYKSLAKKMRGVLLSQRYINSMVPLKWMCEKGHVWEKVPSLISKNNWCDACAEELTKTISN